MGLEGACGHNTVCHQLFSQLSWISHGLEPTTSYSCSAANIISLDLTSFPGDPGVPGSPWGPSGPGFPLSPLGPTGPIIGCASLEW